MPNFAIIENGKVVNTVVAEIDYAAEQGWVALSEGAAIGWDYINEKFVDNRPPPTDIPTEVTKEQLLAQLQAIQAQLVNLA
jgi:hypothetical protein